MGNVQDGHSNGDANTPPERPPRSGVPASNNPVYPSLGGDSDHDYEILMPPSGPTRPAPLPPAPAPPHLTHQGSVSNCHTLGGATNGLEGVPFVINPRFSVASQKDKVVILVEHYNLILILFFILATVSCDSSQNNAANIKGI